MTAAPNRPRPPAPVMRAEDGRRVAGVCAGLARARGVPIGRLRAAFVLGALAGGLGVLVYLACWLVIPAESEQEHDADGRRWIVLLAQAGAACAGLATLAALGATATVFGFGWIVLACAAAAFAGALAWWPRVGPAWALLPIAALALPSFAVAAGGVRLVPHGAHVTATPAAIADVPREGYRSGLGTMLVDLRHTALPTSGAASLRIEAGVRRTIVALPHDRCVKVHVRSHVVPFAARMAARLSGRGSRPFSDIVIFGASRYGVSRRTGTGTAGAHGPILTIDFRSQGASLYVRDYPDGVDPDLRPDWPGYPVFLEPRPDTTGTPRRAARRLVRNWHARRRAQLRSKRRMHALLPGPCAARTVRR
jgi:phage shock protein PspC (stress-responsive transcriptional regulator)